jgi:putative transposase
MRYHFHNMQRTIVCRMETTDAQDKILRETARRFAEACAFSAKEAVRLGIRNKLKLQYAVYRTVRKNFGLPANLAIQAIRRAAAALANRKARQARTFRPTSISYDARTFDWREADEQVSITTVGPRIRVPVSIGRYQRETLRGKKPTAATVVRRGGKWFANIVIEENPPEKRKGPPLGVDLGIRNIATMSTGKKISGEKIQALKERYAKVRASLQSKGTRGAKRVLKRLSGRERRMVAWVNHNVSKSSIREALAGGYSVIRFEDLRGIRERTRSWNKHRNRMIAGWSFAELQRFSKYKAERIGLETEFVPPAWTSRTCHKCGAVGKRDGERFSCTTCGEMDADANAACVIAAGGVEPREIRGGRNATRIADIVRFFSHDPQAKAAGL